MSTCFWDDEAGACSFPACADKIHACPHNEWEGIRVICAWCNKTIKDGPDSIPVSHGICPSCLAKVELPPLPTVFEGPAE